MVWLRHCTAALRKHVFPRFDRPICPRPSSSTFPIEWLGEGVDAFRRMAKVYNSSGQVKSLLRISRRISLLEFRPASWQVISSIDSKSICRRSFYEKEGISCGFLRMVSWRTSLYLLHSRISSSDFPNFIERSSANDRIVWCWLTKCQPAR